MRSWTAPREPALDGASIQRRERQRITTQDSQVAFHDAFSERLDYLLRCGSPKIGSEGAARDSERIIQTLDDIESMLSSSATEQASPDQCGVNGSPDQSPTPLGSMTSSATQTVPEPCLYGRSGRPEYSRGNSDEEEARLRRQWYENYIGWMMYYRSCYEAQEHAHALRHANGSHTGLLYDATGELR